MNKIKKVPAFKTEAEERTFWEKNDSADYIDWTQASRMAMPNLKPTTRTISLRLPEMLLDSIKIEANKNFFNKIYFTGQI